MPGTETFFGGMPCLAGPITKTRSLTTEADGFQLLSGPVLDSLPQEYVAVDAEVKSR